MTTSTKGEQIGKQALAAQRKELKIRLWRERAERIAQSWQRELWRPKCVWCRLRLSHSHCCAMHEVFIKRNYLPVDKQHLIMHEYNCVLAHYNCHDKHGQTREFKLRCARAQYKRYGRDKIVAWVESLGLKQAVEIPREEEL